MTHYKHILAFITFSWRCWPGVVNGEKIVDAERESSLQTAIDDTTEGETITFAAGSVEIWYIDPDHKWSSIIPEPEPDPDGRREHKKLLSDSIVLF